MSLVKTFVAAAAVTATVSFSVAAQAAEKPEELVVYTARKEHLIKPLFDLYTEKTGTKFRYITDKPGPLMARLEAEGSATPADMLITVDAGNLWQASEKGLLRTIESETLNANIPAHLRDPENQWYGLSVRARTLVYAGNRIKEKELTSYEDLAGSQWKDRLCLRTSKKVYNQSLVATMVERLGEKEAEKVVEGWVANLAAPVFSNDTKAMEAVEAGLCDVTIVNTYYFGRLQKAKPDTNLKLFWANQNDSGVHVNVSGAGVTRHAKNPEGAQKFLEWLSTPEAQSVFADENMEYAANPQVKPSEQVASWGEFRQDNLNVNAAGQLQATAIKLMDRARYN